MRIEKAQEVFAQAAARHAEAAAELRRIAAELAAADEAWHNASIETSTPEAFAVLSARRELLKRAAESAAGNESAAAVAERAAGDDLGRLSRSLFDARERAARGKANGNGPMLREAEAQITAITGA